MQEELVERYQNLSQRLSDIKLQNDEVHYHNTSGMEISFVVLFCKNLEILLF